jgi:hypothetical protein
MSRCRSSPPFGVVTEIYYLRFAIPNESGGCPDESVSSCLAEGLFHPMNGSRLGIPRERKNFSQANEMLWMVSF